MVWCFVCDALESNKYRRQFVVAPEGPLNTFPSAAGDDCIIACYSWTMKGLTCSGRAFWTILNDRTNVCMYWPEACALLDNMSSHSLAHLHLLLVMTAPLHDTGES